MPPGGGEDSGQRSAISFQQRPPSGDFKMSGWARPASSSKNRRGRRFYILVAAPFILVLNVAAGCRGGSRTALNRDFIFEGSPSWPWDYNCAGCSQRLQINSYHFLWPARLQAES